MSQSRQIQSNISTRANLRLFDSVTTTDATSTLAASVSLAEGRASFFEAKLIAVQSDFSALQALHVQAGFRRATGGNVIRATSGGGSGLPYLASSGDFSGVAPTVDLIANTSTQTMDIMVKGKAGVTIKWYIQSLSLQNLT